MITKLKFLTAHYNRDVVPVEDEVIGKIYYTSKTVDANDKLLQYVIDVDNNTTTKQLIDNTNDPTTEPNKQVLTVTVAPSVDNNLYRVSNTGVEFDLFPKLTATDVIINVSDPTPTSVDILSYIKNNGVSVTIDNSDFELTSAGIAGFTINNGLTDYGTIDIDLGTATGSYDFDFIFTDKFEPSVSVTLTVTLVLP